MHTMPLFQYQSLHSQVVLTSTFSFLELGLEKRIGKVEKDWKDGVYEDDSGNFERRLVII